MELIISLPRVGMKKIYHRAGIIIASARLMPISLASLLHGSGLLTNKIRQCKFRAKRIERRIHYQIIGSSCEKCAVPRPFQQRQSMKA
jgi:hypothetical protein